MHFPASYWEQTFPPEFYIHPRSLNSAKFKNDFSFYNYSVNSFSSSLKNKVWSYVLTPTSLFILMLIKFHFHPNKWIALGLPFFQPNLVFRWLCSMQLCWTKMEHCLSYCLDLYHAQGKCWDKIISISSSLESFPSSPWLTKLKRTLSRIQCATHLCACLWGYGEYL